MAAQFLIESTFRIRGRCAVVAGAVVSGTVKEGMSFSLPTMDEPFVVESVETITTFQPTSRVTGLCCQLPSEKHEQAWCDLDVAGLEITVA